MKIWLATSLVNFRRREPLRVIRRIRKRSGAKMSKPKAERGLADIQAQAITRNMRVSPRKLNLVAESIRNLPAGRALADLTFSKRRIAKQVKKTLESAIANAENNHQLDVDRLVVTRAEVGRSMGMRRFMGGG